MKDIDHRKGQKVIATIEIEDRGQDFTELDVLANGVLLGDSVMFSHGRLSLLGIGTPDGKIYYTAKEFIKAWGTSTLGYKDLSVYMCDTGTNPLPWKAQTLKYAITGVKKPTKPNRFINKTNQA